MYDIFVVAKYEKKKKRKRITTNTGIETVPLYLFGLCELIPKGRKKSQDSTKKILFDFYEILCYIFI